MKSNNKLLIFLLLASILGCLPFVFQSEKAEANRVANNVAATGYTPPMDSYSNRVGMYSIARQLVTGSTSPGRVRRSSDNSETDLLFLNGELDTSHLLTFVGANDGFVVSVNEQDGGTDITQSTATAQPRIVISGSLVTSGGKPAMDFDGSSDVMVVDTALVTFSGMTAYGIFQSDTTVGNHVGVLSSGGAGTDFYLPYLQSGFFKPFIPAGSTGNVTPDTAIHQMSIWKSSTQGAGFFDGLQIGPTKSDAQTGNGVLTSMGGFNRSAVQAWDGKISELLIFSTAHNSGSTRVAIEDNQSLFYSTP